MSEPKRRLTFPPQHDRPLQCDSPDMALDWDTTCEVCGEVPTVPASGMCGPCTFGDASTINGNW